MTLQPPPVVHAVLGELWCFRNNKLPLAEQTSIWPESPTDADYDWFKGEGYESEQVHPPIFLKSFMSLCSRVLLWPTDAWVEGRPIWA